MHAADAARTTHNTQPRDRRPNPQRDADMSRELRRAAARTTAYYRTAFARWPGRGSGSATTVPMIHAATAPRRAAPQRPPRMRPLLRSRRRSAVPMSLIVRAQHAAGVARPPQSAATAPALVAGPAPRVPTVRTSRAHFRLSLQARRAAAWHRKNALGERIRWERLENAPTLQTRVPSCTTVQLDLPAGPVELRQREFDPREVCC